jgi:hypothetical protein
MLKLIPLIILFISSLTSANSKVGTLSTISDLSANQKAELLGNGSGTLLHEGNVGILATVFERNINNVISNSNFVKILTVGSDSDVTEFATATPVNGKWEVRKFAVPTSSVETSELSRVIRLSQETKNWTDIKN